MVKIDLLTGASNFYLANNSATLSLAYPEVIGTSFYKTVTKIHAEAKATKTPRLEGNREDK